jgi:hypothetical protein
MLKCYLYMAIDCPICWRVKTEILDPLEEEGRIETIQVEIDANPGSKPMRWYRYFSRMIGGEPVPLVLIDNRVLYVPRARGAFRKRDEPVLDEELKEFQKMLREAVEELERRRRPAPLASHELWRERALW